MPEHMTVWNAAYAVLFYFGIVCACVLIGEQIARLVKWMARPKILPPPTPDERDSIARFQRIMQDTES